MKIKVAIVGGGPSALFVYKRLIESGEPHLFVDIFEEKDRLGAGMPYSEAGANMEHVTNVSSNEIPTLVTSLTDWIQSLDEETIQEFHFQRDKLTDFRVLPRLLFGRYLRVQFALLQQKAEFAGIITTLHFGGAVTDIVDDSATQKLVVALGSRTYSGFDFVVICTGHHWPRKCEGRLPGYFDSPYPPAKLRGARNHPIAIRGSSLTAIDAIRTLARSHGLFSADDFGRISFQPNDEASDFKIILHSRNGLLPSIRFHLDDPRLSKESLLTKDDLAKHIAANDGFLSLDFVFEKDFKEAFKEKDPAFYRFIQPLSIEEFVESMTNFRENMDPFLLFKIEYAEAKKSIRRNESIYWKEMLAVLSFAMNYPAKHFSAEDMLRLQNVLMPLISVVIAFAPQRSCEELIALHAAGKLELIKVGSDSRVEPHPEGGVTYHHTDEARRSYETKYETFIDCTGQPHLDLEDFPFKSLVKTGAVSSARLKFRSREAALQAARGGNKKVETENEEDFYLKVAGLAINDHFQTVKSNGHSHPGLYVMAVPFIGGYNPDYSGLDFCEEASRLIVDSIRKQMEKERPTVNPVR